MLKWNYFRENLLLCKMTDYGNFIFLNLKTHKGKGFKKTFEKFNIFFIYFLWDTIICDLGKQSK